jgi:uncharacterized membrane protein YqjE
MLLDSLKGLGNTLLEIIRTRLELLSLDVKEAQIRFVMILMLGAFSFMLLSFGIILGVFWLILIFSGLHQLLVMGILTASLLVFGLIVLLLLVLKLKNGTELFGGTIAELKKDGRLLGGGGMEDDV